MKRGRYYAAVWAIAIAMMAACSGKRSVDTEVYYGTYVGVLPCADCPGILTHVSINGDSTASVSRLYYGSDSTVETKRGRWTYADGIFTVKVPWEELYYKAETDTTIMMVDRSGEVPPAMQDIYRLHKTFYDAGVSE